jgi:hypothetical protein
MRFPFEKQWTVPDNPPSHPGCFVIPSYALKDRSTPTKPTAAQIELAADWWRRFPDSFLIMCTGDNQGLGLSNAGVMADYAVRLGVPPQNVIEEDQSLNTYENLLLRHEDHPGREISSSPPWSPWTCTHVAPSPLPGKWAGMTSTGYLFIPEANPLTVTNGSRPIRALHSIFMKSWRWFIAR